MSGFGGDRFGREHDRARRLAAERLADRLAPSDADFLATHLTWCAPCRAVASEYDAQRLELRSLRLEAPVPPRDLWARTAARIESERGAAPVRAGSTSSPRVRSRRPVPLGALSGIVVIAIVVGGSMLGGRPLLPTLPTTPETTGVAATPFPVTARDIQVLQPAGGGLEVRTTLIDEVCPLDALAGCSSSARTSTAVPMSLATRDIASVVQSPTRSQFVVIGAGESGDDVFVVPSRRETAAPTRSTLPEPSEDPAPTGPPDPTGSPDPTDAPDPSVTPDPAPPTEPAGTEEPPPSDPAPTEPAPSDPAPSDPVPSDGGTPPPTEPAPSDPAPTDPAPSGVPAGSLDPAVTPLPSVDVTPQPDGVIEIASDVVVVGHVAAYSGDGTAFAFTARPADGSHGPDVYLWRVGETEARPITSDHASVFADWVGGSLLISRVGPGGVTGAEVPVSVLVDPVGGIQRVVPTAPMWRPAVDPTSRTAVWWDGGVVADPAGDGWRPRTGRLVLGDWRAPGTQEVAGRGAPVDVLVAGQLTDWQARWDETGTRLAIWIADGPDASIGRLSLYGTDASTGRLDPTQVLLQDVPAGPGFAIGAGRLAWSSPGEDGSTTVSVLAWSGEGAGQVELAPSELRVIVVR